jgi:DNA-binding response OmpR family regulator
MNEASNLDQASHSDQATSSKPLLVLFQEGSDGVQHATYQNWGLEKPVTSIGRWEDNDVVIPDRWVSRYHAQVRCEGTQYILMDLDSKNGLFVNGKRVVQPRPLENGDRIQLSPRYSLTFVDSEATAPLLQGQDGVLVDQDACRVWVLGHELDPPLSSAQFALLLTLIRTPGIVYSRDELRAIAWPDEDPAGISDEAVNSLIRRLRRRLMEVDPSHRYIYAVRGHGFRFVQPEESLP